MPLSPIAELSQELVDEIVDFLAQLSPRPTLKGWWHKEPWTDLNACALVCRCFRARAQVHIFSLISIRDKLGLNRDRKLSLLRDVLERNPRLANHMRELELANWEENLNVGLQDPHLLPILNLVNRARQGFDKLTCGAVEPYFRLSAEDVSPELYKLVGTHITSLSIHIEVFGQAHPHILTYLPHLTELSLYNVFLLTSEASPTPVAPLHYPKLQVLDHHGSLGFVACLSSSECPGALSQLKKLKARLVSRDDILQEQAIADIVFKSLRELDLTYAFEPHTKNDLLEEPITLERCRSLRRLEITVPYHKGTLSTALITKTLRSLPSKNDNTLRELCLTIMFSNKVLKKDDILQVPWPVVGDEIRRIAGAGSLCLYMDYRLERPKTKDWHTMFGRFLDDTYLRSDKDCQEVLLDIRQQIEGQLGFGDSPGRCL